MKHNYLLLSIVSALSLSGCGSDSSNDTPPEQTQRISGIALDTQYIANAKACLDFEVGDTCRSSYQTTTDTNGHFQFSISAADIAKLEQAIITISPSATMARASTSSQLSYQSFYAAQDNGHLTVSPVTTRVAEQLTLSNLPNVSDAAINKAKQTVIEQSALSDTDTMFEDYLADNATSTELLNYVGTTVEDLERAAELTEKASQDPTYADWDTVTAYAWKIWQRSPHNHEFTYRYEEQIALEKNKNGNKITRREGTQWYANEQTGVINRSLPLQHWYEQREWLSDTQAKVHTFFEFDYDQDGQFKFKGELGGLYTYSSLTAGKEAFTGYEVFNEGNPADEGAENRGNREWVDNCPLFDELAKIPTQQALAPCIDFVEYRDISNSAQSDGTLKNQDNMTEWQKDDPKNGTPPSQWTPLTVNNTSLKYYEEREQQWFEDSSNAFEIRFDWNANHYHQPQLPTPFNVIKNDSVSKKGFSTTTIKTPYWKGELNPQFQLAGKGIRQYSLVNPFHWKELAEVYVDEKVAQLDTHNHEYQATTYLMKDAHQYLNGDGDAVAVANANIKWNTQTNALTAQLQYPALTHSEPNWQLSPSQSITENYSVSTIETQNKLDLATMSITRNTVQQANEIRNVFTQSYFDSSITWTVAPDDFGSNTQLKTIYPLIFGNGSNYTFQSYVANTDSKLNLAQCGGDRFAGVETKLTFEAAGDAYIALRCGDWPWLGEMMRLVITAQDKQGNFDAELQWWQLDDNILTEPARESLKISFTRQ
ncbi:hypothetical protein L4D00_08615 [Photobacterium swingsii]|uniref:hypothetical protein n=1 Tax=Photobacterium swingsii TaxID=680026 RepID=UPI003D111771